MLNSNFRSAITPSLNVPPDFQDPPAFPLVEQFRQQTAAINPAFNYLITTTANSRRANELKDVFAEGVKAASQGFNNAFPRIAPTPQAVSNGFQTAPSDNVPSMPVEPELKAPNTAQLAVGGLMALLAPRYAATALAAPFRAGLNQHAEALERYQVETAERARKDLETQKEEAAKKDDEAGGIFQVIQGAQTLEELEGAFAYLDAKGYGDRLSEFERRHLRNRVENQFRRRTEAENEAKLDEFFWAAGNLDALNIDLESLIKNGEALAGQFPSNSVKGMRLQAILGDLEKKHKARKTVAKSNGLADPIWNQIAQFDLTATRGTSKKARQAAYRTMRSSRLGQPEREAAIEEAIRETQANIDALEGELRRQWSGPQTVSTRETGDLTLELEARKRDLNQLRRLQKEPLRQATNTPTGGHRGFPRPPYSVT